MVSCTLQSTSKYCRSCIFIYFLCFTSLENYESLPTDPVQYSFGRFLLDSVKVNFTLSISHRIQHFLRILADGSKHYKPCSDWVALDGLLLFIFFPLFRLNLFNYSCSYKFLHIYMDDGMVLLV